MLPMSTRRSATGSRKRTSPRPTTDRPLERFVIRALPHTGTLPREGRIPPMLRTLTLTAPRLPLRALLILALVALPIAWYLGSPLFLSQTVNESLPAAAPAAQVSQASVIVPAALRSGQFGMIDAIHKGEGTAAVYRQPGAQLILRLDPFSVT